MFGRRRQPLRTTQARPNLLINFLFFYFQNSLRQKKKGFTEKKVAKNQTLK